MPCHILLYDVPDAYPELYYWWKKQQISPKDARKDRLMPISSDRFLYRAFLSDRHPQARYSHTLHGHGTAFYSGPACKTNGSLCNYYPSGGFPESAPDRKKPVLADRFPSRSTAGNQDRSGGKRYTDRPDLPKPEYGTEERLSISPFLLSGQRSQPASLLPQLIICSSLHWEWKRLRWRRKR